MCAVCVRERERSEETKQATSTAAATTTPIASRSAFACSQKKTQVALCSSCSQKMRPGQHSWHYCSHHPPPLTLVHHPSTLSTLLTPKNYHMYLCKHCSANSFHHLLLPHHHYSTPPFLISPQLFHLLKPLFDTLLRLHRIFFVLLLRPSNLPPAFFVMIKSVIVLNNHGQPRLTKFYEYLPEDRQQQILRDVFSLVSNRSDALCNFVDAHSLFGPNTRVIYRHYATLYFVFCVDESESELGILDLIQVFVETLDRCFENVCELDLIFHMDKINYVLDEIVVGGLVLETNMADILSALQAAKRESMAAITLPTNVQKTFNLARAYR